MTTAHKFSLLLALWLPLLAQADITCRVYAIQDGDTLTCVTAANESYRTRLGQVDAPEKVQPYGQRAKRSLSELVFGKTVTLRVMDTDRYGRTVATVYADGLDVNLEQVKRGMAWVYTRYAKDPAYFAAEQQARAGHVGLWADPNPIPPEDWRRSQR